MNSQSPARSYLAFLLVLVAAMLFAAITSPWVGAMVSPVPLHRVFSRLMLLGMIVGTAWLILRYRDRRELLGFNRPWPRFLQYALCGLLGGIALMALVLMPLLLLNVREWNDQVPAEFAGWLRLVMKGLGTGLAVALIEETLFRGAMQGALQRLGANGWAVFAVPLLYSAVHFLSGAARVASNEVNAWSGFVVWQGLFSSFAEPLRILDAFMALYFVGVLLALVRRRWGDIAGCIGMHAGFVTVLTAFRKISAPTSENAWSFLVGSFDGVLGIWIAAITALVCVIIWRLKAV